MVGWASNRGYCKGFDDVSSLGAERKGKYGVFPEVLSSQDVRQKCTRTAKTLLMTAKQLLMTKPIAKQLLMTAKTLLDK